MRDVWRVMRRSACFFLLASLTTLHTALAAPQHCIALYGECKYPEGFTHFDYANPDAPKGGIIKLADSGTFDTLNPLTLKGVKAPTLLPTFESLMTPSLDEPQSFYGLLAESITLAEDRSWAEFVLRKEAKWSDGTPVTVDDVIFSLDTMKTKADPSYRIVFAPVAKAEQTGPRSVKFTFADPDNRELPLIAAQMPIVSKAYYTEHNFEETSLKPPVTSAPYLVDSLEQGRFITYTRNPDYWGKDLAVNNGMNNFDAIRYDMYRDENVSLEAFKAGAYDFRREYVARNWATAYDSPALRDGRFIKIELPDKQPQGMQGFMFNSGKPQFSDRRVREAIGLTLDYEWLNKSIFYGAYKRNTSYFANTEFAATDHIGEKETALLGPFSCHPERSEGSKDFSASPQNDSYCLPTALFTDIYQVPTTDGSGNARQNLLKAQKLLNEAGWL
ncbi:MAG: extracellular solute-binding protein, partial [Alphaproteobacteria bacterium]